jgi:hypothetical protein
MEQEQQETILFSSAGNWETKSFNVPYFWDSRVILAHTWNWQNPGGVPSQYQTLSHTPIGIDYYLSYYHQFEDQDDSYRGFLTPARHYPVRELWHNIYDYVGDDPESEHGWMPFDPYVIQVTAGYNHWSASLQSNMPAIVHSMRLRVYDLW